MIEMVTVTSLFVVYILSILLVVFFHELFHFLVAKYLGYEPRVQKQGFGGVMIAYQNKQKDVDNLAVAGISPSILIVLSCFVPSNEWFLVLKTMCAFNILNLLPLTSDGEIIFLSLVNILHGRKRDE